MEKRCSKCKLIKPFSEFPRSKNQPTGFGSWCKPCANASNKEVYAKNAESRRASNALWREKNKDSIKEKRKLARKRDIRKILLASAKHRAKSKGLEFSLVLEDIVIPEYCPILGIKLELFNESQQRTSPSLDRIDSKKGYTKENLMVISWRANTMKTDADFNELRAFAKWVIENEEFLKETMNGE